MGGEPGARLMFVPAVALVLAYPVPHGAVRESSVGLLLPCGGVGDLCSIYHPLGHAVAWQWALPTAAVAVASPTFLHLVASPHLAVVLAQLLRHVRHGGVGDFHRVPVDHLPQLVSRWKA